LPQFNPQVQNYQLFGVNHTCYEIGGDYYDFIAKDNGRIAIVIADVSGKGVGAALLMAAFQASIRTLAKSDTDPAGLMARLNSVMHENSPANKYITVFYGELDPVQHTFDYVNAGHNPPVLFHGSQHSLLTACGPVVGIISGAKYICKQITLQPEDLLFMYTDGITESQNPEEEEFGEDGVIDFFNSHKNTELEELSRLLETQIREFTHNAAPLDDATLILLKRLQ
jgi:sigma-B regulation protein RsbU (phosphoserine phosphatase)